MEAYATALNYAIPGFMLLIGMEMLYAHFFKGVKLRSMDTISSLSSGLTNIIKDVLGLTVFIITYDFIYRRTGFLDIKAGWLAFTLTFIYKDFAGYWKHRLEHRVNYFWNHHIVHHSSEEFNLPCALRQSISEIISIGVFFVFPLAILGIPTEVMAFVAPIHLFAQFWYHTKFIGRMGFLEYFLVTPSHHRVHHAINPEYIDKNYSQIFIIWDKLFGTFQREMDEVPPVYGVKRAVRTWNPFLINFQHVWLILQDTWRANNWLDKLKVWVMPTGWRPDDVAEKYPVEIIDNVYAQVKFDTKASIPLAVWSWFQLTFTLGLMLYLFNNLSVIGFPDIYVLGVYLLVTIFSYTATMDRKLYALPLELGRCAYGLAVIFIYGDFFYMNEVLSWASIMMGVYFIISVTLMIYFAVFEFREDRVVPALAGSE
jgi:sterol desaturase/sphingolipid hydroxylase (fatty acid hydroxylase superfamily)